MNDNKISKEQLNEHWAKTKGLMITSLLIWAIFSFFIHFFAVSLNNVSFFKFPLGFYLAAQGSLIVFVVLIFWYAKKQNAIDEEFGIAEGEDDYGD